MATRATSSARTAVRASNRPAGKAPAGQRPSPKVVSSKPAAKRTTATAGNDLPAAPPKQSAKSEKTDKTKKATKPAKVAKLNKSSKAAKPNADKVKKPKLVRDSFTIPKPEYEAITALKLRAAKLGQTPKKSELLRAGLMALAGMSDAALLASLSAVPAIKTGRPTGS